MQGTSMLGWLLVVAAGSGVGAAASSSPPEREPAGRTALAVAADTLAGSAPSGCGFIHRGDQSRSLELAVTGLHREGAPARLAWEAPPFTALLHGYEYRAFPAREGPSRAAWVDTGGRNPTVALDASRAGPGFAFEVVARYRFPLPDGHVYYWYGPVARSQQSHPARAACSAAFGHPDTTLAVEE